MGATCSLASTSAMPGMGTQGGPPASMPSRSACAPEPPASGSRRWSPNRSPNWLTPPMLKVAIVPEDGDSAPKAGAGRVDKAGRLGAGAAEVEDQGVAALGRDQVHAVEAVLVPVVLQEVPGVDLPVRHRQQPPAGDPFGLGDHVLHDAAD